MAAWSAIS